MPVSARHRNTWLAVGAALGAVAALATHAAGLGPQAAATAGTTVACATWWVTEPIPVPATSLLPFVTLPLAGVLTHTEAAQAYGHSLNLLLLGGFLLSAGMERSGVHRRIALGIVSAVGGGGRRLVLGVMLAAALCSMWISNTATTLMLLPVVLALIDGQSNPHTTRPMLLGLAYAASIGGLATPVGTPPNVVFLGVYEEATGHPLSFLQWMAIGVPATAILLPAAWIWLTRHLGTSQAAPVDIHAAGEWTSRQRRVLAIFGVTALLWVFRSQPFGGWASLTGLTGANDATVALAGALALLVSPSGEPDHARLLDWSTARRIPWGLLLLFGGGIAIAKGFAASGLADALGHLLAHDLGIAAWPTVATALVLCLAVTFLTEVTSNTATTTLLMPVLAAAGLAAGIDPARLMIPAALSASCAFMLPVATAPNAVVYGSERVSVAEMAREGFVLNLVGAGILTAVCVWLV